MKYLIIYLEVEHLLNFLSQNEKGDLLDVLIKYAKDEIEPRLENKNVLNVFNFLRSKLDSQFAKSRLKSETAKINGSKGGRPLNKAKITKTKPKKPSGLLNGEEKKPESNFETFWNKYNYKTSKPKAQKSFESALKIDKFENILEGVDKYINHRGKDPKYWKHPTTWLNNQCWNDEYQTKQDNHNNFNKQNYDEGTEGFLIG